MKTVNSRANVSLVASHGCGPWAQWRQCYQIATFSIALSLWISLGADGMAATTADEFKKFLSEPTTHGSITYSLTFWR